MQAFSCREQVPLTCHWDAINQLAFCLLTCPLVERRASSHLFHQSMTWVSLAQDTIVGQRYTLPVPCLPHPLSLLSTKAVPVVKAEILCIFLALAAAQPVSSASAHCPDTRNPVKRRTILDIHSGDARAELSFFGIVLSIRKAVGFAATWAQHTNIPLKSLQSRFKPESLLFTCALLQRLEDMEDRLRTGLKKSCPRYNEKHVWSSFSKPKCFLLVWQKTTVTVQWLKVQSARLPPVW